MWDYILKMIPYETIIRFIGKELIKLDDKAIDYIIDKVKEYDAKHDLTPAQKREQVYNEVKQSLNDVADWAINLMIELAVSYLRTQKK